MSEIPGITPQVAAFAQRVVQAGYTAFMPLLFGEPMRPPERGYMLRITRQILHQQRISRAGGE